MKYQNNLIVRRFWKRDWLERPPISFEAAVNDVYRLNGGAISQDVIKKKLSEGETVYSPCSGYLVA